MKTEKESLIVALGLLQSFVDIAKEGKVAVVSIGMFKTLEELQKIAETK